MDLTWNRDRAVAGYLDALTGMRDLAASLDEADWSRPTDLAGWSVQDNVAHVSAIEDELAGRPVPPMPVDWALRPHVASPFQQYTEVGVEARRGWSPSDVVAELTSLVDERTRMLAQLPDDPDAELRGPAGMPSTVQRVVGIRSFDIWAHEQDVRRAVGRPTRLDCPAAVASLERIVLAMPIVLARQVEAPPGTSVRWRIGPPLTTTVVATVDDNGRGVLVDALDQPDLDVTCDTETLALLACGRRRPEQLDITTAGDADLAARVLAAMAITP
jgi:uncharacterized protein (TIGR03083 family)